MSLEADDLLLFARVIEAGSFSRAAERVHLPKSTVSRRLAALEQRLGEKLLQRSTRRLALTEFGEGVLEHARALAAEVDGALTLALHRQLRPSGRLRVSMPTDFANQAPMTAMLTRFALDYPEVSLVIDLSPRRVDLIGEGFDLAIRMGELPQDSQLAARRLATFTIGLYAAPAYLERHGEPQLPDALTSMHGLMILGRSGEPMPWKLRRERPDGTLEHWSGATAQRTLINGPDMLMRFAIAGVGVTAVDAYFAEAALQRGELVRVLPDWCLEPANCWAVFPERRLMPQRTRLFIDAVAAALTPCIEAQAAWRPPA